MSGRPWLIGESQGRRRVYADANRQVGSESKIL
jgi:hypothetical protein